MPQRDLKMSNFLDAVRNLTDSWSAATPTNLSDLVAVAIAHPIVSFELIAAAAVAFCVRTGARI
jgi:hypothetical protein